MLSMTTPTTTAPALPLFTRSGDAAPAAVELNEKGKPVCVTYGPCLRCGGQGGWKGWPGFNCYRCGNSVNSKRWERTEHKLYTADQLARLNATKAKRDAGKAVKQAEVVAVAADEKALREMEFNLTHGALLARAKAVAGQNEFVDSVASKGEQNAYLSDAQVSSLTLAVERLEARAAQNATTAHLGEVGKRSEFTATIKFKKVFEAVYGYQRTTSTLYVMEDANGNALKYMSSNVFLGDVGDTVTFVASVKDHSEYKGVKQTVVTRAKLVTK
jgi:hypothetical protein